MYKNIPADWLLAVYDFVFVLAVCVFGYGVQTGYFYMRDKLMTRGKTIVLFLVSFGMAFFFNVVMKKMGWSGWSWVVIFLWSSNSRYLSEVIGQKIKEALEAAVPTILSSWFDKFKAKK